MHVGQIGDKRIYVHQEHISPEGSSDSCATVYRVSYRGVGNLGNPPKGQFPPPPPQKKTNIIGNNM